MKLTLLKKRLEHDNIASQEQKSKGDPYKSTYKHYFNKSKDQRNEVNIDQVVESSDKNKEENLSLEKIQQMSNLFEQSKQKFLQKQQEREDIKSRESVISRSHSQLSNSSSLRIRGKTNPERKKEAQIIKTEGDSVLGEKIDNEDNLSTFTMDTISSTNKKARRRQKRARNQSSNNNKDKLSQCSSINNDIAQLNDVEPSENQSVKLPKIKPGTTSSMSRSSYVPSVVSSNYRPSESILEQMEENDISQIDPDNNDVIDEKDENSLDNSQIEILNLKEFTESKADKIIKNEENEKKNKKKKSKKVRLPSKLKTDGEDNINKDPLNDNKNKQDEQQKVSRKKNKKQKDILDDVELAQSHVHDKKHCLSKALIKKQDLPADEELLKVIPDQYLRNPHFDLIKFIEDNEEYVFHLIGLCSCRQCSCGACKCPTQPKIRNAYQFKSTYSDSYINKSLYNGKVMYIPHEDNISIMNSSKSGNPFLQSNYQMDFVHKYVNLDRYKPPPKEYYGSVGSLSSYKANFIDWKYYSPKKMSMDHLKLSSFPKTSNSLQQIYFSTSNQKHYSNTDQVIEQDQQVQRTNLTVLPMKENSTEQLTSKQRNDKHFERVNKQFKDFQKAEVSQKKKEIDDLKTLSMEKQESYEGMFSSNAKKNFQEGKADLCPSNLLKTGLRKNIIQKLEKLKIKRIKEQKMAYENLIKEDELKLDQIVAKDNK